MSGILGNLTDWVNVKGDDTLRLEYELNKNSIVLDLGGHEGWFTDNINKKYGSRIYYFEPVGQFYTFAKRRFTGLDNISVFPLGISDKNGTVIIYFNEYASSMYDKTNFMFNIDCITLDKIMLDNNINYIDLIKFNIEGEEYAVLEYMIKNNLIEKCDNIQVQFHKNVNNFQTRYDNIKCELEKTHHLTYYYPFVWENWKKN
jgi:FkbM family methyltransferase